MLKEYHKRLLYYCILRPRMILPILYTTLRGQKIKRKDYDKNTYFASYPVSLAIFITYRCNLRCIQCGQWGEHGVFSKGLLSSFREELSTKEWINFIKQISNFKPYLYFTGGEPLIRDDIFKIVSFATKRGLISSLVSNCVLLEERVEEMIESGLFLLCASIDGIGETNEQIRRGNYSFKKIERGLIALIKMRDKKKTFVPIIKVLTVITKENQKSLLDIANYFNNKLKIDIWSITPGVLTTKELAEKNSKMYEEKLGVNEDYWQGYIREVKDIDISLLEKQFSILKNSKWRFHLELLPPLNRKEFNFFTHYFQPEIIHGKASCWRPFRVASIEPNGDVSCCQISHSFVVGNILKEKFLSIWNGERFRKFREEINKKPFPCCARCTAFYSYSC